MLAGQLSAIDPLQLLATVSGAGGSGERLQFVLVPCQPFAKLFGGPVEGLIERLASR